MATVRVSWKGVSSIGYTMRGNLSLEYNGTALTKGFTSTREVTVEQDGLERKFTVECKILGDGMGTPSSSATLWSMEKLDCSSVTL